MPPKLCCRTIVRDRSCVPFPQDCVHGPATRHGVYRQSIGHGFVLQWWCSSNDGHDLPPCIGATTTVRDRDCAPTPQVSVQAVKYSTHSTHSRSYGCELHAGSFCSCGHALPPCAGCVVTRLVQGILNTPPQVFEQLAATPRDRSSSIDRIFAGVVPLACGRARPVANSAIHRTQGERRAMYARRGLTQRWACGAIVLCSRNNRANAQFHTFTACARTHAPCTPVGYGTWLRAGPLMTRLEALEGWTRLATVRCCFCDPARAGAHT